MPNVRLETLDIHSTDLYVERGYPWQEWDLLRKEAPVFWYERDDIAPFWAITRHQDILTISKHSDVFVNSQRLRLQTIGEDEHQIASRKMLVDALNWDADEPMDFIFMDDPRHRNFRLVTAKRFTPAWLRKLETHFDDLSRNFASELNEEIRQSATNGEDFDFVRAFAQKLPLAAIGEMMGLPTNDWMRLKQLTNVMIGAPEVEFYQPGETFSDGRSRAFGELNAAQICMSYLSK